MTEPMQAPYEMTQGFAALKAILADRPAESSEWSEASNRFNFVDRLLKECLGWQNTYLEVEFPDGDGGRADYILGSNSSSKAVLEIKREAVHFGDLPTGKPAFVRKMSPLLASSKNLTDAAKQVVGYCSLLGIPLAVVSNGPQMMVFQSSTTGHPPLEGECFFFNGFEEILEKFDVLWRLLSPEGVSENRALKEISQYRVPRMPPKASDFFVEPKKYRYRSVFQEEIQSLSSLLLEDLEDSKDLKPSFYRDCYVADEANSRHLLLSKKILTARYKRSSGNNSTQSAFEMVSEGRRGKQPKIVDPSVLGAMTSRPIVVLGDVGVGKTSFFENLFYSLPDAQKNSTVFLHLNLGLRATMAENVKMFVLQIVPKVLREEFGVDINNSKFCEELYESELLDFDLSPAGILKDIDQVEYTKARVAFLQSKLLNADAHLTASLSQIVKTTGKQIVVVIDNADQRSFDIQQEAFLIAQELAETGSILVFVALRPSTYFDSKARGAMSGYKNKVLTISPPPADLVIQRRIAFALRVAEGKENHQAINNIKLQLSSVVLFLKSTLRSVRSNREIQRFLGNITGGNTRAVVELVTSFFGSPNVDSEKIVRIESETGDYKVPLHEFTKHALLGDFSYFHPQSSQYACNVFDPSTPDPKEHFLSPILVSYLAASSGERDADGFMFGELIISEMQKYGFRSAQTRSALRVLASKRLIETPHSHFREIIVPASEDPDKFHFRATSIGIYHSRYWIGTFQFLDAVSSDTPIFADETRALVTKLAPSFQIDARHKKVVAFIGYLEACWNNMDVVPDYYDFPTILKNQSDSIMSVERAIRRY